MRKGAEHEPENTPVGTISPWFLLHVSALTFLNDGLEAEGGNQPFSPQVALGCGVYHGIRMQTGHDVRTGTIMLPRAFYLH